MTAPFELRARAGQRFVYSGYSLLVTDAHGSVTGESTEDFSIRRWRRSACSSSTLICRRGCRTCASRAYGWAAPGSTWRSGVTGGATPSTKYTVTRQQGRVKVLHQPPPEAQGVSTGRRLRVGLRSLF